jgi:quercetin dioxygenase-like cupin family protein
LSTGDNLDLSRIGMIFRIRKTAAESGGRSFEMEMDLLPGSGGTPLHIHPSAEETYEVLRGTFEVNVGGAWATAAPGDRIVVPAGTPHTFRNSSAETVTVYNAHRPAMKFQEYFTRLHRLANSNAITSQRVTPKAMLHLSMLMSMYPEEIQSVNPPGVVVRVLSAIGRLLGYRV